MCRFLRITSSKKTENRYGSDTHKRMTAKSSEWLEQRECGDNEVTQGRHTVAWDRLNWGDFWQPLAGSLSLLLCHYLAMVTHHSSLLATQIGAHMLLPQVRQAQT